MLTSSPKRPQHFPASPAPLVVDTVPTDAYGTSFLVPRPANPTSVMNFFLRISRPGNGLVYLGYLSEHFLEGLRVPDTHQPNVIQKVGHKPGIQQVGNGWRTEGEGGEGRRGKEEEEGEEKEEKEEEEGKEEEKEEEKEGKEEEEEEERKRRRRRRVKEEMNKRKSRRTGRRK